MMHCWIEIAQWKMAERHIQIAFASFIKTLVRSG